MQCNEAWLINVSNNQWHQWNGAKIWLNGGIIMKYQSQSERQLPATPGTNTLPQHRYYCPHPLRLPFLPRAAVLPAALAELCGGCRTAVWFCMRVNAFMAVLPLPHICFNTDNLSVRGMQGTPLRAGRPVRYFTPAAGWLALRACTEHCHAATMRNMPADRYGEHVQRCSLPSPRTSRAVTCGDSTMACAARRYRCVWLPALFGWFRAADPRLHTADVRPVTTAIPAFSVDWAVVTCVTDVPVAWRCLPRKLHWCTRRCAVGLRLLRRDCRRLPDIRATFPARLNIIPYWCCSSCIWCIKFRLATGINALCPVLPPPAGLFTPITCGISCWHHRTATLLLRFIYTTTSVGYVVCAAFGLFGTFYTY
jgi:hypothetical protein